MKNKIVLVLTALLIACMIAACGNAKTETNNTETNISETNTTESGSVQTKTIFFPNRFEHLSSMTEEKLANYFKDRGEEHYCDLSVEDGLLKMSVTEEQIEYWKEYIIGQLEKQESVLTAVSPKYIADFNEKHDTISVYYDAMMSSDVAFNYVGRAAMFCAMYQLFDGADDFSISLNVYNSDTGKLVAGGNLEKDDVSYDNTEWGLSYTLSEEEAEKLTGADIQKYDVIRAKSTFIDGMSVIDILQQSGGNDYKYLYLDESNTVVMAVDENQKSNYLENMVRYLESVKSQFEKLGDSYEITWNDEFSALDLYFDSSLSKQEQTNYLNYTETLCMLCQLLSGDGESYYIDIRIHDSSTGALVSEGNTVDGITFNIGDK